MVEVLALGAVVTIGVLAVLLGVPRAVGGGHREEYAEWPAMLDRLERVTVNWLSRSRLLDVVIGVLAVVVLAVAVGLFQDGASAFIVNVTAALGLAGLFAAAYLSLRRSALSGAEATLIGMSLVGTVLMILIAALLLD